MRSIRIIYCILALLFIWSWGSWKKLIRNYRLLSREEGSLKLYTLLRNLLYLIWCYLGCMGGLISGWTIFYPWSLIRLAFNPWFRDQRRINRLSHCYKSLCNTPNHKKFQNSSILLFKVTSNPKNQDSLSKSTNTHETNSQISVIQSPPWNPNNFSVYALLKYYNINSQTLKQWPQ